MPTKEDAIELKIVKTTAQSIIGTAIVALLLGSGAVYAVSTRAYYSSNQLNAPSTESNTSSTTNSQTSAHSETEHGHAQDVTTHTSTSDDQGEDENEAQEETCTSSSTSTSAAASTSATTTTSTSTENEAEECDEPSHQVQQEHEVKFTLVPASGDAQGKGEANIQIKGTTLRVDIEIEHAMARTTYSVVLVSVLSSTTTSSSSTAFSTSTASTTSTATSGCGTSIGTFVTSDHGNGHAELETTLQLGSYQIGILICSKGPPSTPLLVSDPATSPATITQTTAESENANQHGENVQAANANQQEEDDIKSATDSKEIPAVVQVSGSSASVTQVDPTFTVSVGKTNGNGVIVSISGENVTGPRVLLVNLTGASYTTDSLKSLMVTYDGNVISQASSLSQVLNSSPSDPARFIVLVTSSSVQLLVSIPHFSSHVIQIISGVAGAGSLLAINAPILVGAILVGTMLVGVLYAKRRRV